MDSQSLVRNISLTTSPYVGSLLSQRLPLPSPKKYIATTSTSAPARNKAGAGPAFARCSNIRTGVAATLRVFPFQAAFPKERLFAALKPNAPMPTVTTVRVATRPSALALRQAQLVIDLLVAHNEHLSFEIVKISTRGDAEQDRSL